MHTLKHTHIYICVVLCVGVCEIQIDARLCLYVVCVSACIAHAYLRNRFFLSFFHFFHSILPLLWRSNCLLLWWEFLRFFLQTHHLSSSLPPPPSAPSAVDLVVAFFYCCCCDYRDLFFSSLRFFCWKIFCHFITSTWRFHLTLSTHCKHWVLSLSLLSFSSFWCYLSWIKNEATTTTGHRHEQWNHLERIIELLNQIILDYWYYQNRDSLNQRKIDSWGRSSTFSRSKHLKTPFCQCNCINISSQ